MHVALLADLTSGASNKLAEYAVKCLAVGGGFLVGYFVGRVLAWGIDRWVFAHKAPEQLKRVCALLCGLALAIVVALIVFGSGGGGLFGGGGGAGEGKGAPSDDQGKPVPPAQKDEPKVVPPKVDPKPPEPKPTAGDLRVAILGGGDVQVGADGEGRFYLIDGEREPKSLPDLKQTIAARRKDAATDVVLVFRFTGARLDDTHREMLRLNAWLREAKLLSRFE